MLNGSFHSTLNIEHSTFLRTGAVAQLGEHLLCKQGVVGSIPISSTRRDYAPRLSRMVEPEWSPFSTGYRPSTPQKQTVRISGERSRKTELSADLHDRKFLDN